jgi:hypothetical protein
MEKPKRARKRKLETSQGGPEAAIQWCSGGQGVHREVESEGLAEKYRAVINGGYGRIDSSDGAISAGDCYPIERCTGNTGWSTLFN